MEHKEVHSIVLEDYTEYCGSSCGEHEWQNELTRLIINGVIITNKVQEDTVRITDILEALNIIIRTSAYTKSTVLSDFSYISRR
jgi:hypothetical protein